MSLLSLRQICFTWGGPPLLDRIDLEIEKGQRIGLLGRNGCGKSTLLRILAGEIDPDDGEIRRANGLRVARLMQEVPSGCDGRVAEIVAEGAAGRTGATPASATGVLADETMSEDWKIEQTVGRVLSRMSLDGQAAFGTLSSGMKRRVLMAKALAGEPDILLLDEPTNHIDVVSISWLERFLKGYDGTLVFVTHDRAFLQSLATRIIEIDRGHLFDWTCDYTTFLKRKQAVLEAEDLQNRGFDRKLAQEEAWIRQGIKARRTRNEGRVRALQKMREERRQRRERIGNVRMQISEAQNSGRLVIEAKNVSFAFNERPIIRDFSTGVSRGDKIGIIGRNGSGKTTLLRLLLGDLKPNSGTIRHGTGLEVVYFDQLREQIDEEKTVVENVGEGQEILLINGKRKHILGYLQDFLFTPERARRPARFLSGGERNRILLAQLFKRPSNVIVLDEPTNDLDVETLELLEELLANYSGTLFLVSHDREFLNNVVTATIALEGDGSAKEFVGGYDDYVRQRAAAAERATDPAGPGKKPSRAADAPARPSKLSYQERRELESLPLEIDKLETERDERHTEMSNPNFFKQDGSEIAKAKAHLESIERKLAERYTRWEDLERRA